ncbi:hypothetical protein V7024_16545 [Bacillus sp. JJ864]|uniref:hypothetical protein n=1 Tax=Bacillus sp. JJ864 TaxID=3122975 RepID=UPI002FFF16D2
MKKSIITFIAFTLFCVSCSHNTTSSKETENTGAAIDDPALNSPEGKKLIELGKRKDEMAREAENRGFYRTGTIDRGKFKTEENSLGINRCDDFKGEIGQFMKVKKDENWSFSLNEETQRGIITAYIIDSYGNIALQLNNEQKEKNIKIPKDDVYQVKITGENFSGNFLLLYKQKS